MPIVQTLDGFVEIAQAGAANAGSCLARWLGRDVAVGTATVEILRLDLIPQDDDQQTASVTLASRIRGGIAGNVAVQLTCADASMLIACLGGNLPEHRLAEHLGALEQSMLQETANILFSSLMNGFAKQLGLSAVPHTPIVLIDVGTAAWGTLLIESAEDSDHLVVITTPLACANNGPSLRLVFLPAPAVFATLGQDCAQ
ncbi:hypothetical protein LBMAG53_08850 [Planctomycetota bacterium]|nr:hypothetical protein LBMAG53_08850 [Planctomycetota bacterium]